MEHHIGELLDNRYEILEPIGSGGMAYVYKARCHRLNRFVAVKVLRRNLSQDADFRRRFQDESQAVAMLSHPNIVSVYDVSCSSDLEYIVMELIDGITLKQYTQKRGNLLNWREALHFITQITKALGHAHSRGIIHRDIKPHNIMVLRDGSVKVADFGIARQTASHSTLTQEVLGSVHYISPEQAKGSHIDARSDLYSVGVVLYEMITGRLPFEGDSPVSVAIQHIHAIPLSPREINPEIPEALEAITMRAMAPNPNNRYTSADEMLADLEEFRKNPSISFDYSHQDFSQELEEPSAAATQVINVTVPVRDSADEEEEPRRQRKSKRQPREEYFEDDDYYYQEKAGFPWAGLLAIVSILVFVGGLLYFLYNTFFASMLTEYVDYPIPSVVGEIYEEAMENESLLGEFVLVIEDTVTDDSAAGTILSQEPSADSLVRDPASQITVTVSGGPEIITMIDVTNQEYLRATVDLRNMGLEVASPPAYVYDDDVPSNYIISYSPAEGTELSPGSEVTLVVSLGPEEKQVDVVSLVGMTQSWAETQITLMNLKVGTVTPTYSDTVPEGEVISQSPEAYSTISEGSTVNLVVSMGPEIVEEDIITTKTVQVNMPTDGAIVHVQVTMGDKSVYSGDVDTAMNNAIYFEVSGTGSQTMSIYFDGVLSTTQAVDFGA